ncbi:MAG: cupin domain-containing protein [Pseudomonadota bacterium]
MTLNRLVAGMLASAALLACISAPAALAHETGNATVIQLRKQALPDAPGKNVIMVTVNYAPGQASDPHVHPGSVFAYVLEGEVISQLEGQEPVTYKAGDYWYETPKIGHLVSRNASSTKPAKLLVWLLVGDGEQLKLPISK